MTLSSSHQSPVPGTNTPTIDTARTAAVRAAIHAEIEPSTGWWQFELQPWHYWTAITSCVVLAVGFGVIVAIGLHR